MNTVKRTFSDAELDRQLANASKRGISEPEARSAKYRAGQVHVELASGWNFAFDPKSFAEFASATEDELKQIGLWGSYTLACPPLDAHLSIGGIILELLGEKFVASELGRMRGGVRSAKKSNASRENGKRGGRPRKV